MHRILRVTKVFKNNLLTIFICSIVLAQHTLGTIFLAFHNEMNNGYNDLQLWRNQGYNKRI